jgi:signal transduction histidine kinase
MVSGLLPPVLTLPAVLLGLSFSLNILLITQQQYKSRRKPIASIPDEIEDPAIEAPNSLAELQTRFILMLSHEYRTPLTTILTTTELLERYGNKITDQNKQRYHHRIKQSVQHLIKLLNDTLLLDDNSIPLLLQPLDITAFCHSLLDNAKTLADDRLKLIHHFDHLPTQAIVTDELLLRQILIHLLSNAIKFSPTHIDDRYPLVKLEVLYQSFSPTSPARNLGNNGQDGLLVFKITDFGIGIPDQDRALIYDRFYRGNNIGTIGGTGIGLTLAKSGIDRLGGTLQIKSQENHGTTARISLPVQMRF